MRLVSPVRILLSIFIGSSSPKVSANALPLASPNASAAAVVIAVPFVKALGEESFNTAGLVPA